MTQDTTLNYSAREATSLGDSHRLYQKAVKLVTEVNTKAAARFPQPAVVDDRNRGICPEAVP